ncbi:hypothetical protein ASD75_00535 [Acidovorax sp. Root568]|nr:hypothetical protein ASD75_00535 [Acidovorax sp. Root568]
MSHDDQLTAGVQSLQIPEFARNALYRMASPRAEESNHIHIAVSNGYDLDRIRRLQGSTRLFLPTCSGSNAVK